MSTPISSGLVLRVLLSVGDALSDAFRGASLLHTGDFTWGLLTFIPLLFSVSASILYGIVRRENSSFLKESLSIHGRIFGGFLSAGPQILLWSTSILSGVHSHVLLEWNSPLFWIDWTSFALSAFSFMLAAHFYDKECFSSGSKLRSLTYFAALAPSLAFRLLTWGSLLALIPLYTLGILIPCAYILTLALYRLRSKNWECLLYAFSSLLAPSGHGRRQGRAQGTLLTTVSGVKMVKLNLESIVERLRLFSVLFHCLSLGLGLALIVSYETTDDTAFILMHKRLVLYGCLLGLFFLSLGGSALYHKVLVVARNATRLWDAITPAATLAGPSEIQRHVDPRPQPLNVLAGDAGNNRCDGGDRDECVTCELMITGSSFRSSMTGREYKIMTPVNCTTRNVIYLVTCNKCRKQYVGKTEQMFKQRHYGHRREIETKVSPLGKHFAEECGYTNWRFQIIDSCEVALDLTRREGYWQQELQTYTPNGLNSRREKVHA